MADGFSRRRSGGPPLVDLQQQALESRARFTVQQVGIPVHEYWLEHKRALMNELAIQREEMLDQVHYSQQSALLGLDLVKDKLEKSFLESVADGHELLYRMHRKELAAWAHIRKRESALIELQNTFNERMLAVVEQIKESEFERLQQEQALASRRHELENWADSLQRQLLDREKELGATTRQIERDLALLHAAKRKDSSASSMGSEQRPNSHIRNFAAIVHSCNEVPRIVVGEPFRISAFVDSPVPLAGTPVTITYLEGKGGVLSGSIVSAVESDGHVHFNDLVLEGPKGTTHTLLISMPRVSAGTIAPCELPVHLLAPPDIVAVGHWNVSALKLCGVVRARGIEPFGLLGVQATITLRCAEGKSCSTTSFGSEANEFVFDFDVAGLGFVSWAEVAASRWQIESDFPLTKYTNSFIHQFDVRIQREAYPTFQFPHRLAEDRSSLVVQPIKVPQTDLSTEIHLADNGTLMASANVSFQVCIYGFNEARWAVRRVIQHDSFVSHIAWSTGGKYLGLLEPKRCTVYLWSVADLVKNSGTTPAAEATMHFSVPSDAVAFLPHEDGHVPSLLVQCGNMLVHVVQQRAERGPPLIIVEEQSSSITAFTTTFHWRLGWVAVAGLESGEVVVVSLQSRKTQFQARLAVREKVLKVDPVGNFSVLLTTANGISVLSMKPVWSITNCPFRPPVPIHTARASSSFAENGWVLLVHSDGNVSLLDFHNVRIISYGQFKGCKSLSSVSVYSSRSCDEFVVSACDALYPVSWILQAPARGSPVPEQPAKEPESSFPLVIPGMNGAPDIVEGAPPSPRSPSPRLEPLLSSTGSKHPLQRNHSKADAQFRLITPRGSSRAGSERPSKKANSALSARR